MITENLFSPLKERLSHIFDEKYPNLMASLRYKEDNTPITQIDILFSEEIKKFFQKTHYKDYTFFSEEDYQVLSFPSIIVDPIDGTRELSKGVPECAVSIALMQSCKLNHPNNLYWLYNPFTKEEISFQDEFSTNPNKNGTLMGYVSRTEWKDELYRQDEQKAGIMLKPLGSIAYKLMLLAIGKCDFVITKKDKNIWDIAGGSILLNKIGFKLYDRAGEIIDLKRKEIKGPLLWCQKKDYALLKKYFFINE